MGEIIRLRRFGFEIKNGNLVGSEEKFSNWLIYRNNKLSPHNYKD